MYRVSFKLFRAYLKKIHGSVMRKSNLIVLSLTANGIMIPLSLTL